MSGLAMDLSQISQGMNSLRKAPPKALQGFGHLAKAAMTAGAIEEKHKELIRIVMH